MHVNMHCQAVGKPLTEQAKGSNRTKSTVRGRVEHIFGAHANDMGGTLVRTIGLVRAKAKIGLKNLLWLPPVMQEVSDPLLACDRVRTFVRPQDAAFPKAAGRDGDQRIGSKSRLRAFCSQVLTGFPNPDLFDRFAHSGRRLLTPPWHRC